MSYPRPPESPGGAGAYGQHPHQPPWPAEHAWQPGAAPPAVPPLPPAPPQPGWHGTPAPHGGPVPPYGGMPAPPPPVPARRRGRGFLAGFLGVVGALAVLGGGLLTNHAYSNHSRSISNRDAYGPSMWRNETVETLFPAALAPRVNTKVTSTDPSRAAWHRVGISDSTDCTDGLNNVTTAAVKKLDCEAVLRATYVDPTGNTVATVALVVLPEGQSAKTQMTAFFEKDEDKLDPEVGAKAYGVPGTIAEDWNDERSNGGAGITVPDGSLPYVLIASAGAVDGRKAGRLPGEWGSHSWDAGDDRAPWRGAAKAICDDMSLHLSDLLLEAS
ncbi:hypothetical protein [Streptomyces lonegramiae]|nr:hypothetical protein [Streptomyces sp. DSM 41529]